MNLHNLPKLMTKSKKRIGRGIGSGKGKTSGRGHKGQKARGKIPAGFIGGSLPLYRKLPFKRGLGNSKVSEKAVVLTLNQLTSFKAKSTVNLATLIEKGLISEKESKKGVKILGEGEVKVALIVELPVSQKAKQMIEKAGGKVV